ncbi:MAG: gfo/Idh/MocA family oxidoreductase, partial [Bryobacterales bacterium]|nr:gfo/Idh/MocA family oxidoreductase [Bryobacterales bacterium]
MRRRQFLALPGLATAKAAAQNTRPSPNNRVTMAVIGTGNQGIGDMKLFLRDERVQVVAVCDVNKETPGYWDGGVAGREPARVICEWHYAREKRSGIYKGCAAYEDFREVLARKDIDTVLIALPDHWHSIPVIQAAR